MDMYLAHDKTIVFIALILIFTGLAFRFFSRSLQINCITAMVSVAGALLLGALCLAGLASAPMMGGNALVSRYVPVHYVVLLDDSASESLSVNNDSTDQSGPHSTKYAVSAAALLEFAWLHRQDRIALTTVSDTANIVTDLTAKSSLDTYMALPGYKPRFRGTNLIAGLEAAIWQFRKDDYSGPKALIISSDGIDSFSPSELEGLARKMTGLRIQVFRLGVLTSDERADKHLAGLDIDQLVSRLHGRTFLTTTATETQSAYARIGELTGGK